MRQGPRRSAGITPPSPPRVPCPWPGWVRKCYPGVWAPRQAVAVPPGLRGRPRPPRLLSSRSLRLRLSPAWLGARHRKREGDVEAAEEPAPPGETSRGQHRVASASSARQAWGRQATRRKSPLFRTGQGPPDQSLDWIKVGTVSNHHKNQQLPAGTPGCPRAIRVCSPGPQRWVPQPPGPGNGLSILAGALGAPTPPTY